ncbi:FGGY-family carbohydrate kinase [Actinoplanes sp. NPDC004185]
MIKARVLLGIDAGQTVTKAALYTLEGDEVAAASRGARVDSPHPRWAERDMDELWQQVCEVVGAVIAKAGPGYEVAGVGVCGHNDGLYAVDEHLRPVRPAILAMDSRAHRESTRLGQAGTGAAALALTGQQPSLVSPASVLSWLREHEPGAYERTRWTLFCKDWIRLRLTGEVATDVTEASAAFTDLATRRWSRAALQLFGLADAEEKLPVILDSEHIAGRITGEAARATGLAAGTPVITGVHDVDAAAAGVDALSPGSASLVLGTYSINQVVSDRPLPDPRWQARSFVRPGRWLHMSTSPAGASCLDWAMRRLGPSRPDGEPDPRAAIAEAMTRFEQPDLPLFLPFLYGSPHGPDLQGTWLGLRGRHDRADLLAAVLEGVAFNHRTHMGPLSEAFDLRRPVRVCGGGARSAAWTQILADVLDLPVEVTDSGEAGARGVAMLAGVGVGEFADLDDAARRWVKVVRAQQPRASHAAVRAGRYRRYRHAVDLLSALDAPHPGDG